MSISSEITRITNDKNKIRNKLISLNLAQSSDNLDVLANAVNNIVDRGTPNAQVAEGSTYTIQAGYYHGGTVQGVAGNGSYSLQTKTVTPSTSSQSITPDSGYYGLSQVEVNAIPSNYVDVSSTTANAANVLSNKTFVNSSGTLVTGNMPNNGNLFATIDGLTTTSYTIPMGYHNGNGTVSLTNAIETELASI